MTQHISVINIKIVATCFGSIEPSSDQIQDTVLVHSASAYIMGSNIVYNCTDIIDISIMSIQL